MHLWNRIPPVEAMLKIFLFIIINLLLLWLHFWLFNVQPVYGFITGAVHVVCLLMFPYSKVFKITK